MAGFTGQAQFLGAPGRQHEAKDELEDGPRDPRAPTYDTHGGGRTKAELEAGGAEAGPRLWR